jgi:hypothetical protein
MRSPRIDGKPTRRVPSSPARTPRTIKSEAEIATELTPLARTQVRHWIMLLAADDTAPAWNPFVRYSTPATLRSAACWLVDNGHASEMTDEMVCILLALFIGDLSVDTQDAVEAGFIPQDAA